MPSSRPRRPVTQLPSLLTRCSTPLAPAGRMAASASPAYCRALIQRLRGGTGGAQADAAAKLAALVWNNGNAADMAAAAGAIPALIQALRLSGSAVLQRDAAKGLTGICLNQPARLQLLIQSGGIPVLLPLLAGAGADIAAGLLASIAAELPDLRQQIGAAANAPLLACVRTSASDYVRELALTALINLWVWPLRLVQAGMGMACKHFPNLAHGTVACRTYGCPPNRAALVAAGAMPDIVGLLRSSGISHKALTVCATLLSHLLLAGGDTASSESVKADLIALGGVAALRQCLRHSDENVQAAAAGELAACQEEW